QLLDALFEDRRFAGADQVELGSIDVHADQPVPVARQAGHRNGADVPQPENADALRSGRLAASPVSQGAVPVFVLKNGGCTQFFDHHLGSTLLRPTSVSSKHFRSVPWSDLAPRPADSSRRALPWHRAAWRGRSGP